MKPFAILAVSTSLVLALLQACSTANPHATPLPDCLDPACTIDRGSQPAPVGEGGADALPDVVVPDTSSQ